MKGFFVIDDFLKNPDQIRLEALKSYSTQQHYRSTRYPGTRILVENDFIKEFLRENVSKLVGENVRILDCCYQFIDKKCVKGLPHDDRDRKYSSIIYLNPSPPRNSGTEIFDYHYLNPHNIYKRDDKIVKEIKENFSKSNKNFIHRFLYSKFADKLTKEQKYKCVVGNRYNRHLLFDSSLIHRAQNFFGEEKNSRLTLITFFK
jgi:hypothetical protein